MTIKFANRVKVSTSTTGTGTLTLGSAVDGFQTFAQGGILNGESIRYTIINGNEWEVGTGVYSGTTMSRSYEESSTGSLLNLAGDSEVFITVASTDIENIEDTANNALPKAGGTMTGDINLGDDTNVNFGAGPDLSIFSDGTKGLIKALSGAKLMLRSTDSIVLQNTVGSADMLEAVAGAGVTLFYDDDPKIASTTTGAAITGSITVSGTVDGVDIATRDGVLTTTTTTANAALPKAGGTMTGAITFAAGQAFDGRDVSADGSKLDGIESGATGDQTNAEIRAAVEAATDSNVFTDADHTKLNAIEANADVTDTTNVTAAGALMDSEVTNLAQVKAFDSSDYATAAQGTTADAALPKAGGALTGAVTTNSTFDGRDVSADGTKLDGIEANATADQTGAEIKALYEAEANAYTDAKDTKLSGIETGATADQTASEIRTLVESATDSNVFTDADHTKLNGIEASADITDTTNVTAAGALMDSEVTNLAQVKAFDSSDYATAAQGSTADAALPKAGGTMTGAITFDASQTFDAADLTGTLPAIDGSNLTNVPAVSVYVNEATDTETDRNIIFASGANTGSDTQLEVKQDAGGIAFNPLDNTLKVNNANFSGDIEVGFKIQHQDDSNTYISFNTDTTYLQAGGNTSINIDGINNNVEVNGDLHLGPTDEIIFDGVFNDGFETRLKTGTGEPTADRIVTLPDATGTLALDDLATTSADGLMSSSDKTKLDGIEANATADQTAAEIRTLVEAATDSNVFTDADHTKLNGIEASADITDTTNVTAAGALMDSELTNEAAVKAINQGLTTTSDVTFNDVTVSGDLTVSGTTTTVNTETINLADNQILLNSNFTGTTPTENGGIEIERGTQANKTLIWDETNDRWTVGSETFVAGSFVGDGSNLTNVAAASIEVSESADDNVTYNILFSDTGGSGNVQMTPTQDDGGLTYNPALDTLSTYKIQVADSIVHRDDTNTYIDFGSDEIRLVAGGVEFIKLVEGTDDYVRVAKQIYLASGQNINFEGSTYDTFQTVLDVTDPTADRTITLPDATGTVALDDVATTSAKGLMSSSDKTKLDGIETSADVTDTTNVTAAGALMDSEVTNLAQVKAFDSSDYATAAQGATADAALPKAGGTMTGVITFNASQTFDAADLTGTLPAIDGSNLTNVAASTIEVIESSDTNAFYPLLFASNNGSGNVQKSVVQDKDGSFINLSFNPSTNQFLTNDIVLYGEIAFHGSTIDSNLTTLTVTDPTANRTITLPNATGTVALTSDIVTYSNATTSANGLMSSADKTKLDGIEASADVTDVTNVTAAGALMDSEVTNLAQVKAFDSADYVGVTGDSMTGALSISQGTAGTASLSVTNSGGSGNNALIASFVGDSDALEIRNDAAGDYKILNNQQNNGISIFDGTGGVKLRYNGTDVAGCDSTGGFEVTSGNLSVTNNITVSGTVDGRDVATDGTKLDGIEASADVTDTANVTAAGALMDSELADIASVKALNQGVATTDSPTFAALTVDGHTLQNSTDRSGLLSLTTALGTWRGIQIEPTTTSKWSLMGNQTDFGLYDDQNGEWILNYNENSTLQLYANGSNTVTVNTNGLHLNTNRYIQFEGSTADGFETNLTVANPTADRTITLPNATGTVALDDVATTSANGLMSSSDKTKLDGISVALTAGIANFIGR